MKTKAVYTATPVDEEPMYWEDNSRYVVSTPGGRIDFTMRDVLRSMKFAPTSK